MNWCAMLSRIQQVYSLTEIAAACGTNRTRFDNLKRGIEPKWELGVRLLAIYESLFGQEVAGVDAIKARALADLAACEKRQAKAIKAAAKRRAA